MDINWNPSSRTAATAAGVLPSTVDTYARLLKKLGLNQELTQVVGL
jgi:hypothetical protein